MTYYPDPDPYARTVGPTPNGSSNTLEELEKRLIAFEETLQSISKQLENTGNYFLGVGSGDSNKGYAESPSNCGKFLALHASADRINYHIEAIQTNLSRFVPFS